MYKTSFIYRESKELHNTYNVPISFSRINPKSGRIKEIFCFIFIVITGAKMNSRKYRT